MIALRLALLAKLRRARAGLAEEQPPPPPDVTGE